MMIQKFLFKKDASSTFLLIAFTLMTAFFCLCLITDFSGQLLIFDTIIALVNALLFTFYFNSYCLITGKSLIIKTGIIPKTEIPFDEIYYLCGKTQGPITQSTYISKLQITYNAGKKNNTSKKGKNVIVSPENTQDFIDALKVACPKIINEIKTKKSI